MAESFDFDEVIDRREVPALKVHRMVLGNDGMDLFPAGVADMDFRAPKPVLGAMAQRLAHGVFGYETVPDGLMPALIAWMKQRHAWDIPPDHILRAPNVLNSLSMAANLFTRPGFAPLTLPVWAVKPWFGVGFHSAQLSSVYGVLLYPILRWLWLGMRDLVHGPRQDGSGTPGQVSFSKMGSILSLGEVCKVALPATSKFNLTVPVLPPKLLLYWPCLTRGHQILHHALIRCRVLGKYQNDCAGHQCGHQSHKSAPNILGMQEI